MINLHNHSVYSYKNAIASIKDIIQNAKDNNEETFCITDLGSITAFVKAMSEADKNNLKFIPGCEFMVKPKDEVYSIAIKNRIAFLQKEMRLKRTTNEMYDQYQQEVESLNAINVVDYHSLVLLAKDMNGFKNLVHIFNKETQDDNSKPFLADMDVILNHSEGLIALSGGFNSEMIYWILNGHTEKAEEILLKMKDTFDGRFFVQLEHQMVKTESYMGEIEAFNILINLAKKHGVPFVCSNNAYYVNKEDRLNYRLYKNIMSSERIKFTSDDHWMMDEDSLKEKLLEAYPNDVVLEGFENIKKIDEMCEKIPALKAPNLQDASKELIALCEEGWNKLRKGTEYEEESKIRYQYELEVINGKNFSQYFIKVLNIIKTAKDLGILIGPGRGSGCGSEICYLIGITSVDPLKYGLFFERFLNPERASFPDIDIDMASVPINKICDNLGNNEDEDGDESNIKSASRNILVDELVKRGIFNFSGFIQNEVTASTLVLFKNLAKYHEIPFHEANKISTDDEYAEKLKEKTYSKWLEKACDDYSLEWEDVWDQMDKRMDFCYKFNGIPHNTSIAASGVIMADFDTVLPVHNGVIGFNGVDLESWGYIKYDLLSVNTLNAIQYFEGLDLDWNDVDDPKVWKVFQDGDLDFVFQFAGFVPTDMCKKGKPSSIEHLAEINAINRPGPLNMNLNQTWVDIQNGEHKFEGEDLMLAKILKKRFGKNHSGLIIYQEDVMALCQEASGFSMAEADTVRKAMGKKIQKMMDEQKPKFIDGWKDEYRSMIEIEGVGGFFTDEMIELNDGSSITALELYERIQSGEEVEIKI